MLPFRSVRTPSGLRQESDRTVASLGFPLQGHNSAISTSFLSHSFFLNFPGFIFGFLEIFDFSFFVRLILQYLRNFTTKNKKHGFRAARGVGSAPEGIIKPPEASQVHVSVSGDFRFCT